MQAAAGVLESECRDMLILTRGRRRRPLCSPGLVARRLYARRRRSHTAGATSSWPICDPLVKNAFRTSVRIENCFLVPGEILYRHPSTKASIKKKNQVGTGGGDLREEALAKIRHVRWVFRGCFDTLKGC